jgi:hypothetical protein
MNSSARQRRRGDVVGSTRLGPSRFRRACFHPVGVRAVVRRTTGGCREMRDGRTPLPSRRCQRPACPGDERAVLSNASVVGEIFERRAVESRNAHASFLSMTIRALPGGLIRPAHSGRPGPLSLRHVPFRSPTGPAEAQRAALRAARAGSSRRAASIAEVEERLLPPSRHAGSGHSSAVKDVRVAQG